MAELTPPLKQRFFDSNGDPLSGGKLFSYAAGTLTPKATYTDRDGTLNANPVILDANGEANVWIDAGKYKFILKNSLDVIQWTVDKVGNPATDPIPIANGGTGQITKTAAFDALSPMSTIGDLIVGGAAGTGVRFPSVAAGQYLRSSGIAVAPAWSKFIQPTYQSFLTAGSATYNLSFYFKVPTSATATIGATYTNNGITYTVTDTVIGVDLIRLTGNGDPTVTGTLTKSAGTGDATLVFTSSMKPVGLIGEGVGAGAGGGGGANNTLSTSGTATTFGSSLITIPGGTGSATGSVSNTGGAGGSLPTTNSPAIKIILLIGSTGNTGMNGTVSGLSGAGGSSFYLGAGTSASGNAGFPSAANSGSGGGGGSVTAAVNSGHGGGSGAYAKFFIPNPSTTYSVTVGTKGAAAGAGTNGQPGGAGGDGALYITEVWQ